MTVTTRRERRERERRRQQRKRGGGASPAPRGIGQIWIVAGVVVALVALIVIGRQAGWFEAPASAPPLNAFSTEFDTTGQTVGTKVERLDNSHIPTGQKATYNTVPPTSGNHWAAPAAPAPWGIKDTTLPNEVTTHNLEHGGIVIAYNDLSKDEVDKLRTLVKQLTSGGFPKVILEPYPDLKDAKVALTAWTWIYKLPGVDQTQIIRFFRAHYDPPEAPEQGVP